MRLHIFCPTFFRHLHLLLDDGLGRGISAAGELTAQLSDNGLRQLGLDSEDIFQIAGVVFRPDLVARSGLSQPGRNAHGFARLAHTSFDQMGDAELLSDLLRGGILTFKREGRSPCRHPQAGNFLQHGEQFLTDPIGKILASLVIAEVREREDSYRLRS